MHILSLSAETSAGKDTAVFYGGGKAKVQPLLLPAGLPQSLSVSSYLSFSPFLPVVHKPELFRYAIKFSAIPVIV